MQATGSEVSGGQTEPVLSIPVPRLLRWSLLPVDLRWVSIAVDDRSLLLHHFLWERAPVDLRYLTVESGDMDWLYIGGQLRSHHSLT